MFKSMILGPSKVGKTALVASLSHASNIESIFNGRDVDVAGGNPQTLQLFSKALDVVQSGDLQLQGTQSTTHYEFRLTLPSPPNDFMSRFVSAFTGVPRKTGHFHFLDSPGGAVFESELINSRQTATRSPYFREIAKQMLESNGLILCVDANDILSKRKDFIKDFFFHSINTLLTNGFQSILPFKRVCVTLTKADLWAQNSGHVNDAQAFVENADPVAQAIDIIGKKTFQSFKTFMRDDAKFGFAFSSVYGFENGGINTKLMGAKVEQFGRAEDWRPFQVLDPFAFLTTGQAYSSGTRILNRSQLEERL